MVATDRSSAGRRCRSDASTAGQRHASAYHPRLCALAQACRSAFAPDAPETTANAGIGDRSIEPKCVRRGPVLQAFLMAAVALPGMLGAIDAAKAAPDDVVAGTVLRSSPQAGAGDVAAADDAQEFGIQYSHYQEGARALYGPVTTGILPAAPGSSVSGSTTGIGKLSPMTPIKADGEHAYARFRLGDRSRIGFDYVQDIWSGASPLATLPANMVTGASTSAHVGGYFNSLGQPVYQTTYQANANPSNPTGTPQHLVFGRDNQIGHAMGYASPETRRQGTVRYGYDWNDTTLDAGAGVSSESDFLSRFGNLALRRDFNDKLTSANLGLSLTRGQTHAEWNADGYHRMATDAWPNQLRNSVTAGTRLHKGALESFTAPLVTGDRQDVAITGGVTQVVNRDDLFSTGLGFTHTTGFLTNPWKGANVLFPAAPDPAVLAAYPSISYWYGTLELEKRPSLRNQFTWDASYLHFLEAANAAVQAHYSLFVDSWGIAAHTVDVEWRQRLGADWTATPRLRYYTQKAADFYAPYFFATSPGDLPNHNFSSDERLAAYGTLTPGLTLRRELARGLALEFGIEYQLRSGGLKMGGGGDGSFVDLHSYTANVALRGSLDRLMDSVQGSEGMVGHAMHGGHHGHADAPAGVMGAHMMDDPGSVMVGYIFEQDRQGGTPIQGNHSIPRNLTQDSMWITDMKMNMHMFEFMVAQNRWLNWMVMPQFVDTTMNMSMFEVVTGGSMAGMIMPMRTFMSTGGLGDTTVAALIGLWNGADQHLHLSQGLSLPTGSVNQRQSGSDGGDGVVFPYDMQTGSGTWDYKPGLTYTGALGAWNWGAQGEGTVRLQSRNGAGYALGNQVHLTAWVGYKPMPWLNATVRALHTEQGAIRGQFNSALPTSMYYTSDYSAANYGGRFDDLGLGVSTALGGGTYANDRISAEWLRPVRTDFNGTQNNRIGTLVLSAKFLF